MGGLPRAVGLVLLGACYQPTPPTGVPCSTQGDCPGEQACVAGVCGGTLEVDAPVALDAPIDGFIPSDAPIDAPNQIVMIGGNQIRDTEIWIDFPTTNYGGQGHLSVDDMETSLVWFDLTSLSSNAVVVSATLRVMVTDFAATNAGTVLVHRMREAWVESEATWAIRATGQAWSIAGARPPARDNAAIATLQPAALMTAYDVALPAAMVQEWITQPASNYGLAFVRGTTLQHVHFGSREGGNGGTLRVELQP